MINQKNYASPYVAGVGLGLVLLAAIFISGRGLGASGAIMSTVVAAELAISESHVTESPYLSKYGSPEHSPFDNWLVFEVLGVLVGGVLSGAFAGRLKKEINHGPRISRRQRLLFAAIGGGLFGFGARLARGCTSGVALTGGATLALGSWVTMLCIFIAAYGLAYTARKLWI